MRYLFEQKGDSPSGTNDAGPLESYEQSGYYDVKFPQRFNEAKPIVLRANIRGLYGKVDTYGFAVVPKMEYISEINTTTEETHEALLVVRESFEEMADYYKQLDLRGKLSLDSKTLKELVPKKSWKNPMISYASHQSAIMDKFISLKDTDSPEIVDYKTFEKSFMEYATSMNEPFTMSGYSTSKLADSRQTGLVIDLAVEDYSEDKLKYEGYIQDPNFQVFRKVINRYGFRIDKHIPWRIYFDVMHPHSRRKLAKYGVGSLEQFFQKYYDRIANLEIEGVDSVMNTAYKKYYDTDPYYTVSRYCNKSGGTIVTTKTRETMSLQKLNNKYSENHWIRAYVYFRAVETGVNWNQAKFDKIVRESISANKYRGLNQMVLQLEPYFIDKTDELFHRRDLTKQNSFDTMISYFRF